MGQVVCFIPGPDSNEISVGRSLTLNANGYPLLCGYDQDGRFGNYAFSLTLLLCKFQGCLSIQIIDGIFEVYLNFLS